MKKLVENHPLKHYLCSQLRVIHNFHHRSNITLNFFVLIYYIVKFNFFFYLMGDGSLKRRKCPKEVKYIYLTCWKKTRTILYRGDYLFEHFYQSFEKLNLRQPNSWLSIESYYNPIRFVKIDV